MGPSVFYGMMPILRQPGFIAKSLLQALDEEDNLIGVIVCKLEPHRGGPMRGYIAMLATRQEYRGQGIASALVRKAVEQMIAEDADEVSIVVSQMYADGLTQNVCRSLSKPRSITSPPCAYTRTWAFCARSVCTAIT